MGNRFRPASSTQHFSFRYYRHENHALPNAFAETLRDTLDEWPSTQKDISSATGILASHLSEMKSGRRRCAPEYDLRLSRFFGMDAGFWMRLQLHYEMQRAQPRRVPGAMKMRQEYFGQEHEDSIFC